MRLDDYTTLGRTGLRVSPLCLGAMTFGDPSGRGADERTSHELLARYVDAGGNFIDTADIYTGGRSEEIVGRWVTQHGMRDRVVIASKYSFNAQPGNPNAGGNGRKNAMRALDGTLRRLATDYVDLYYLHVWDRVTPAEEVVDTLSDLVRAGKIRYWGLSDAPAWYASRVQTLAEKEGKGRIAALQHEYSLVERTIEQEHLPAAQALGIGVCAWAPLAGGLLSGKYRQAEGKTAGAGRLVGPNQIWDRFTERNWNVLSALLSVAEHTGRPPAQVALRWVLSRPGITSTLVGATKTAQLDDALAALDLHIPAEHVDRLDAISALPEAHPYKIFGPKMQRMLSGGTALAAWKQADVYEDLERPAAPPSAPKKP